jgi:broad specificity phosphatase PhoE
MHLATRLILLGAAGTAANRAGAFPCATDALDDGGLRKARRRRAITPAPDRIVCSPHPAARETAAALGLEGAQERDLADIDNGRWAGRPLADIERDEPERLAQWLGDPGLGAPDGETMAQLVTRVGGWLDRAADAGETILAVTHAAVMRAALVHGLGLAVRTTFQIDIAPLSLLRLSFNGKWRMQELGPL